MKFEMRKLTSKDIFPICRIITKIGLDKIKDVINGDAIGSIRNGDPKDLEKFGFAVITEIVGIVISNIDKCEKDLFAWLADLCGTTPDEMQNVSMAEFAELIISLVKSEEFADFFKAVSGSFK